MLVHILHVIVGLIHVVKRNHLTRVQMDEVIKVLRKNGIIKQLAEKYDVSEDLIKHVRRYCKRISKGK